MKRSMMIKTVAVRAALALSTLSFLLAGCGSGQKNTAASAELRESSPGKDNEGSSEKGKETAPGKETGSAGSEGAYSSGGKGSDGGSEKGSSGEAETAQKAEGNSAQTSKIEIPETPVFREDGGVSIGVFAMDTYMELLAYGDDAEAAILDAAAQIHSLDDLLSTGNADSEISKMNAAGGGEASEIVFSLVEKSIDLYQETGGLFDISIYPVMKLWGFPTQDYRVPGKEELAETLKLVDASAISIGEETAASTPDAKEKPEDSSAVPSQKGKNTENSGSTTSRKTQDNSGASPSSKGKETKSAAAASAKEKESDGSEVTALKGKETKSAAVSSMKGKKAEGSDIRSAAEEKAENSDTGAAAEEKAENSDTGAAAEEKAENSDTGAAAEEKAEDSDAGSASEEKPEEGTEASSLRMIRFDLPGMEIDLGGIAKGYTGNCVMEIFRKHGVSSGLISLGGNVQALGSKEDGKPWRVAVRDPGGSSQYLGILEIDGKAVVTSGGYERFFEQDGVRYHHIIDPRTGFPADSGLLSATIVSNDGTLADGLSTSLFIMGKDEAAEYWRSHADEFDYILEDEAGTLYVTEGIRKLLTTDRKTVDVLR